MANTLNLGDGNWATKEGSLLGYNSENNNYKPLPFDFSRGSTPTGSKATTINKDGLIETVGNNVPRIDYKDNTKGALLLEPSRTNLNTHSQDFSNAAWTKGNTVITSNTLGSPDGTINASTLTDNTANTIHRLRDSVSLSASTDYSLSIFAKKGTLSNIQLALINTANSNTASRVFDLENGALGESITSGGTLSDSKITDYGNGWYRCEIIGQLGSTPNTCQVTLATQSIGNSAPINQVTYDGDGNGNVYLWGAMLEQGSYSTSYIPTQGGVVTRLADNAYQQGVTQVIGQSEGTIYIDFIPKSKDDFQILYQIRTTGNSNVGQIDIRLQSGNIRAFGYDGGSSQFNINGTYFDVGTRYKCAIRYKQNDVAFYINGVLIGTDSSASFSSSSKNQVSFGENLTSLLPIANIIDAKLYNNSLTNSELQALTTI